MAGPSRELEAGGPDDGREALVSLPDALLDDPLGFIDAHHARQRYVCRLLRHLATERRIERGVARDVAVVLTHDLALHHRDEDDDLFPLLRKRALPEDDLTPMLVQLAEEHVALSAAAGFVAAALSVPGAQPYVQVGRRSAGIAGELVTMGERHLAIENAIVMVIARKRLRAVDLKFMSRSMKARRGAPA